MGPVPKESQIESMCTWTRKPSWYIHSPARGYLFSRKYHQSLRGDSYLRKDGLTAKSSSYMRRLDSRSIMLKKKVADYMERVRNLAREAERVALAKKAEQKRQEREIPTEVKSEDPAPAVGRVARRRQAMEKGSWRASPKEKDKSAPQSRVSGIKTEEKTVCIYRWYADLQSIPDVKDYDGIKSCDPRHEMHVAFNKDSFDAKFNFGPGCTGGLYTYRWQKLECKLGDQCKEQFGNSDLPRPLDGRSIIGWQGTQPPFAVIAEPPPRQAGPSSKRKPRRK